MKRKESLIIYQQTAERFRNTQSIQWRMNISVWSLISLAIYGKEAIGFSNVYQGFTPNVFVQTVSCVGILAMHVWYLVKTQLTLNFDKGLMTSIVHQLNDSKKDDINVNFYDDHELGVVDINESSFSKFFEAFGFSWILLQIFITLTLISVFLLRH